MSSLLNPAPASPTPARDREADRLRRENTALRNDIAALRRSVEDARVALAASNDHADSLQNHLYSIASTLRSEVSQHRESESSLEGLLTSTRQEREDLEAMVDILVQQGDSAAEFEVEAHFDPLTQLPNRRMLDRFLSRQWRLSCENREPLALVLFDVDHFKLYNDHYGHQAGDTCLRRVAETIGRGRPSEALAARYGGEEFALVLPRMSIRDAVRIADSIRSAIYRLAMPHAGSLIWGRVSVSIGVACFDPASGDARELREIIEEADHHLYQSKGAGRNRTGSVLTGTPADPANQSDDVAHGPMPSEFLQLSFSPLSAPLRSRWRNNGLSADFLGDYATTFLPAETGATPTQAVARTKEIRYAVTYVANELLENAMKYHVRECDAAIELQMELSPRRMVIRVCNAASGDQTRNYMSFADGIRDADPAELAARCFDEAPAPNPESGEYEDISGLGLITMMNDFNVKLDWNFRPWRPGGDIQLVTTSATLEIETVNGDTQ